MNSAEILRAAAARVRQGWCQQAYGMSDGRVCALGAIGRSSGQAEITHYFWNEAGMDASLALENFVSDCVADWNDRPWQTAENVARTMEAAADQWEAEHADQVAPPVVWTARERVLA